MPSPAFLLARHLSPQTRWGPNDIPGGIPDFTAEDLKCATGYINDAVAWMAVDAGWLGGRRSDDGLLKLTEAQSWRYWKTSHIKQVRDLRQGMMLNWLLSELAYLDWYYPNNTRGERGCADFLSQYECDLIVTRHAYRTYYKDHVQEISNWLSDKEQWGLAGINQYLREAA